MRPPPRGRAAPCLPPHTKSCAKTAAPGKALMPPSPCTITGLAHERNRNALDWRNGLLAVGVQHVINIVDPETAEIVQSLDGHKAHVCEVRWAPRPTARCTMLDNERYADTVLLASADASGQCAIWDVRRGVPLCWLSDVGGSPARATLRMHWLPRRHDVLVCVHSPNVIAAYQVGQMVGHLVDGKLVGPASLIWRVDLPESIYDAAFDAHDGGRVAAFCGKGILMQFGPLEVRQPPQRLTMQSVAHLVPGHAAGVEKDAGSSGSSSGARGRQQPADKGRLLQLEYSLHESSQLYLLLPRELILWDLSAGTVLGNVWLDRTDHDFTSMAQSLALPSTVLGTHHDGCLSRWERCAQGRPSGAEGRREEGRREEGAVTLGVDAASEGGPPGGRLPAAPPDVRVVFAFRAMVPLLKGGGCSLLGFRPSLPDGERFGGLSADGRIWLWRLPYDQPPATAPGGRAKGEGWQLEQCGLLASIGSPITSLAVQPAADTRLPSSATDTASRCLAVGVESGHILLIDLGRAGDETSSGAARRTACKPEVVGAFDVHASAAKGLQWLGRRSVLSYSSVQEGRDQWKNSVQWLRLPSGRCEEACPLGRGASVSLIGARLSPSGRRLVLIFKDAPLQIWDLPSRTPLATHFVAFPSGAALDWRPGLPDASRLSAASSVPAPKTDGPAASDPQLIDSEELVFAVPDGSLFHIQVRGIKLLSSRSGDRSTEQLELADGVVTALALGGPWVISGTLEGMLSVWHATEPACRHSLATHRGMVKSIALHAPSPTKAAWLLLVLFADGDQALWTLPHAPPWTLPQPSSSLRGIISGAVPQPPSRAIAIGFTTAGQPLIACDDGCIRLLRADLSRGNTPVLTFTESTSLIAAGQCLPLASRRERLLHQTYLVHLDIWGSLEPKADVPLPDLPSERVAQLRGAPTLPTRCRLAAELLGCEQDARFWSVAEALLWRASAPPPLPSPGPPPGQHLPDTPALPIGCGDLSTASEPSEGGQGAGVAAGAAPSDDRGFEPPHLPPIYGALREPAEVRTAELDRLEERMAPSRAPPADGCRRGAFHAISLDAKLPAISLLLTAGGGSDASEASMETERDLLLACLVAGFVSPQMQVAAITSDGTLIASDGLEGLLMNSNCLPHQVAAITSSADRLCAAGKLPLAVPLLFLIGRGAEACERLQRAGRWEHAATLAKASLPASERDTVLGKWAEHLLASGEHQRGIEVLLSLGRVQEVAERLLEQSAFDKAALLLCALREPHPARRGTPNGFAFRGAARVVLEYAAFLSRLNLHALSARYCELASTASDAVGSAGFEDEVLMAPVEAQQLVVQLARLQERREEPQ
jgi:WD40 repeat protein